MKFNHNFNLVDFTDNYRLYACDDVNARLDFVEENIVRVAIYRHGEDILPTFCINPYGQPNSPARNRLDTEGFHFDTPEVESTENGEKITLSSGIEIDVDFHNFLLSFVDDGEVLFEDRRPLSYNLENEFGRGYYHYVSREEDEKIFGLGDKSGFMDKSGRSFRIETTDAMGYDAETSDPLYKHIPFYICENSVGNYGVFYDTSATCYMDFGVEINNYYQPYTDLDAAMRLVAKRRIGAFRPPQDRKTCRKKDLAMLARAGFSFHHWAERYSNIHYIFSKDCKMTPHFLEKHGFDLSIRDRITYVSACEKYEVDDLGIESLHRFHK